MKTVDAPDNVPAVAAGSPEPLLAAVIKPFAFTVIVRYFPAPPYVPGATPELAIKISVRIHEGLSAIISPL